MDAKIGSVTIESKIDTQGVEKGSKDIKKELDGVAEAAGKSVEKVNQEFDDIDTSQVEEKTKRTAKVMKEEFSDAADKIGDSFEEVADTFEKESKKVKESVEGIGDESKKTEESVEKLTDKIEKQEKELSQLKTAYINAVHQYGEASEEARRLSREIEDLSSDLKKNKNAFEDAADAADKYDKSLDGISGFSAESIGNAVSGSVGGFAGAVAGSLVTAGLNKAIDALEDAAGAMIEFGKESINVASDLEEVQNVVDVVFPSMTAETEAFAESAAKSAGLSETMAKKYVGTFGAMAESLDFTEQQAFQMSATLTQLTGDVASFYNLDHDEAYDKLKSVFTGETEALKELGVVMTQAALDSYALEKGLGKVTSQMSQQELAALRYEFVLEQLGAASGDFQRTQENWANQTRILTLQWDNFKATVGSALIEELTPTVQYINDYVMPSLQELTEWAIEFAKITDGLGDVITGRGFQDLFEAIGQYAEEVDGSAEASEAAAESQELLAQSLAMTGDAFDFAAEAAKKSIEIQIGLFDQLNTESQMTAAEVIALWKSNTKALLEYEENLQKMIDAGYDEELIKSLADGTEQSIQMAKVFADEAMLYVDSTNEHYHGLQDAIENVTGTLNDLNGSLGENADEAASSQEGVTDAMQETKTTAETLATSYDTAGQAAKASADQQAQAFDSAAQANTVSAETIVKNAESITAGYQKHTQTITNQFEQFNKTFLESSEAFAQATDEELKKLTEISEEFADVAEEFSKTYEELQEISAKTLGSIEKDFNKTFDSIYSSVRSDISSIQSSINSLTGKSVNVTVTTTYVTKYETIGSPPSTSNSGGSPKTYNAAPSLAASYEPAAMNALPVAEPYLAEGTVVPPMATFPAVAAFSSMRRADNEELIREIVRAENSGLSDGLDDVNENLNTLIGIVSQMNLDGNMIFNSYNDRERKMAIVRGVRR